MAENFDVETVAMTLIGHAGESKSLAYQALNEAKKGNFEEHCICGSSNILRLRRVSGYLSDVNTFTVGKFNELQLRSAHVSKI